VDPGGMALPLRQDPSTPPPEPPREPSGRLRRFRAWLRAGGAPAVARDAALGLWGHSQGGVIALLAALDDPAVGAVATWSAPAHPDHYTARQKRAWREAGAKIIASRDELVHCRVVVDVALDRGWRFTRAMDFLPMAGRTPGTCALRCKQKPAIIFFGPALSREPSGWPGVEPLPDDDSYENRLLGAVGLRALRYEYAFTDDFDPVKSRYGPGAGRGIARELERALQPE